MGQVLESRDTAAPAAVHGDPLPRRAGRWLVRAFGPVNDVLSAVETGVAVQRPIVTGRRIAVDGPHDAADGGAVAALLSLVFAHYRQDRVLALDVASGQAPLARRFGAQARQSLVDIAREAPPDSFDAVEPLLSAVRDRLWLLPGSPGGRVGLDVRAYRKALLPLSRFFGVTVIRSGSGLPAELRDSVAADAHAHVLVAEETRDGVVGVGRILDRLVAADDSAPGRTVVVLVAPEVGTDPTYDLPGAVDLLRGDGIGVFRLGRDRHLSATSVIDPRRLARATHTTVTQVAAEVLRRSM
ncbi:MinD/ParA family ATP-binding protein [Thermobifida cellulosilytica]|uniref:MinD-like ATPase involved in chromosome partitioning or flagellar assembly n=1 Tax=Thermobifida cellulosilytica TB100 TaxID=665004 RepID=A0A147KEX4_THECS|nr:hypothetical protein [Thermobifida cellulosilytica]KUP95789.1 hypothetical protein AC529_15630 [Thermobifida cellulosilytica TB100]